MSEAKARKSTEESLYYNWRKMVHLLLAFKERWDRHSELVRGMNIDYVAPDLQQHVAQTFNYAEFYIGLPELVNYAKMIGGLEYLQVKWGEQKDGR
jgi:hypothetical protein